MSIRARQTSETDPVPSPTITVEQTGERLVHQLDLAGGDRQGELPIDPEAPVARIDNERGDQRNLRKALFEAVAGVDITPEHVAFLRDALLLNTALCTCERGEVVASIEQGERVLDAMERTSDGAHFLTGKLSETLLSCPDVLERLVSASCHSYPSGRECVYAMRPIANRLKSWVNRPVLLSQAA
jgi:hypothetical protein